MVGGDLGEAEHADDDAQQAERHDPADRHLVDEPTGDRHGHHGADALGRDQEPGLQRGLAADLLEVRRHQQQPAEERRGEQEHRDDRDGEVAVPEQPQVEQRVLGPEGVPHEREHQQHADQHRHPHPRRVKSPPLGGQRGDAEEEQREAGRHQRHADEVEGLRRLGAVLGEHEPGVDQRRDARAAR